MKIIPIAVLLFFMNLQVAFCPNNNILTIPASSPISEVPMLISNYSTLIDAIFQHESGRNTEAYNAKENAVGGLQIRQCRLDHYNKLTGNNYTLNDMYNFEKAREVFIYFTNHDNSGKRIRNKSYEQAAKNWNGSGPMTELYWSSIKPLIHT